MGKVSIAIAIQLFFCGMVSAQTSERELQTLIDSACISEKFGGGPIAYERCVYDQLSKYRQSDPIPDMSRYDRSLRTMIDSACSSEKHGGGPAAYARCVTNQLSSYSQSVPIPDMSGFDRKMRAMIDSACSSEKHGGGPAAYARCATSELTSYSQSIPIPDMSGFDRKVRAMVDSACSSEKHGGGPAAYARCVTDQLLSYRLSGPVPDMSRFDQKFRRMVDSACSSEKHGGGPAAYALCVTDQLSSYRQSSPIPDMSRFDKNTRRKIDSACISEKYGGGPAAYARCVANQLSNTVATPLEAQIRSLPAQPLRVEFQPRKLETIIIESVSPGEPLTEAIDSSIFDVELSTSSVISQLTPPKRRDENVYQAQFMLELLGYDPGPLDGQTGPRTKTAIQKFQQDSGLKGSSEASTSLLEHLRDSVKARTAESSSLGSQPSKKIVPEVSAAQTPPTQNRFVNNVKNVQLALQAFGYYSGTIDGVVSAQTGKAITALQTDYGLRVTGTVTPELFAALGIEVRGTQ